MGERKYIEGNWKFEFIANRDELKMDTKIIELDEVINLEEWEIKLKEVKVTPVDEEIDGSLKSSINEIRYYHIELMGEDDKGQEIIFSSSGIGLPRIGRNNIDNSKEGTISFRQQRTKVDISDAEYIILTPYGSLGDKLWADGEFMKKIGEPFKIYLNK